MKIIITNRGVVQEATPHWIKSISDLFTLQNPAYLSAKKYGRKPYGIPKDLKFYQLINKSSISFSRGATGLVYKILSEKESVQILDYSSALPEIDLSFKGDLRPYQVEAVQSLLPKRFGVLEAGTGSGKTVMGLYMIAERKQPTLVVVHTKELLHQWKARIKSFLGTDCGLIGDGNLIIRPITVAIVNTAVKNLPELSKQFGHLIVDECHRVPANLFRDIVEAFSCRYMLGLSATPYRNDGLNEIIGWLMGSHRVVVHDEDLREAGAILRPNIIIRETQFGYGKKNKDYQTIISELIENEERNQMIVDDLEEQTRIGGLSLVVSDRIEHLHVLSKMTSIKHLILTGSTKPEERKKIVARLGRSGTSALFSTVSLIGEGFDCPGLTNLFVTTPIKFEGRLKQLVGRIVRPMEGKTPNVYDYFDRHVGMLKKQGVQRQKIYLTM